MKTYFFIVIFHTNTPFGLEYINQWEINLSLDIKKNEKKIYWASNSPVSNNRSSKNTSVFHLILTKVNEKVDKY